MRAEKNNVTIKDIAREANVSIATVSRVLNQASHVSSDTARRVHETIQRLSYMPNGRGSQSRPAKNKNVLIVLPSIANPFFSSVVAAITNTLYDADYDSTIWMTEFSVPRERRALQMLAAEQCSGIISFISEVPDEELYKVASTCPFVMAAHRVDINVTGVSIDDAKAMYEATEHVIRQGHKRLAMIGGTSGSSLERKRGFIKAAEDYGLELNPACLIDPIRQYGFEFENGSMYCEQLLSLPNPPTAILSAFDTYAIGAAHYAVEKGIKLGKELAIVGFDNSPFSKVFVPSVTSVSHPLYELGTTAAKMLLYQMQTGKLEPAHRFLPHELIIRQSSQR
jgi:LacI family transcriptional regulator, repressor for deo operon, udp, cdd, tsx, nupC, and nupG